MNAGVRGTAHQQPGPQVAHLGKTADAAWRCHPGKAAPALGAVTSCNNRLDLRTQHCICSYLMSQACVLPIRTWDACCQCRQNRIQTSPMSS